MLDLEWSVNAKYIEANDSQTISILTRSAIPAPYLQASQYKLYFIGFSETENVSLAV